MREGHPITEPDGGDQTDPTSSPEPLASLAAEALYEGLAGYGFARRYVKGKVVANIDREGLGYGARLLSEAAEHVVGLAGSNEEADLASRVHPVPNVEYRGIDFPAIPFSEGHFDVVVALGAIEDLSQGEELVREAKRVLKRDGVLIVSTPDRRALLDTSPEGDGRRRGMYVPEFREFLSRHFGRVRVFRQGAVAGGFVFPEAMGPAGASVESVPASASTPLVGPELPTTGWALAMCFRTEGPEDGSFAEQEQPYLLLDRDRRVFDEREDRTNDVELLRGEIERMRETEVQAFQDTYRLLFSEIAFLRARVRRSEARARQAERDAKARVVRSERRAEDAEKRIRDMENSATWRVFEPYRQLRTRLDDARKGPQDK